VDYNEAERMKRQYGVSKMALEEDRHETGHTAEDRVRVAHALGLHLEQLVAELEASFRYFAFELGGTDAQRMDRLILTGGGGLLKSLPEFLTSRLSVPVSVADPLRSMRVDPVVGQLLQSGWNQRVAVALGLASRPIV
jgi:Tfp pilus assembly PilM family ATPase